MRKVSRSELKLKKALGVSQLTPVENAERVNIVSKEKGISWVISNPEIYKADNVFVIFGDKEECNYEEKAVNEIVEMAPVEINTPEVPASGLKYPKESVEMVMTQLGVPLETSLALLEKSNGDVMSAIMSY